MRRSLSTKMAHVSTGQVAATRRVLHHHLPGLPLPERKLVHAGVLDRRSGVPDEVEGEQQPVLIVEEAGIDHLLHEGVLARELGADVGDLHVLPGLVLPLEGDPVLLRLPDPGAMQPELGSAIEGERVPDGVDLSEGAEPIGLCHLVCDGRALLRRRAGGENQQPDRQNADQGNATRRVHRCLLGRASRRAVSQFPEAQTRSSDRDGQVTAADQAHRKTLASDVAKRRSSANAGAPPRSRRPGGSG